MHQLRGTATHDKALLDNGGVSLHVKNVRVSPPLSCARCLGLILRSGSSGAMRLYPEGGATLVGAVTVGATRRSRRGGRVPTVLFFSFSSF